MYLEEHWWFPSITAPLLHTAGFRMWQLRVDFDDIDGWLDG